MSKQKMQSVTKTMYVIGIDCDGQPVTSLWNVRPSVDGGATLLSEIEVTYEVPADLSFLCKTKADRIAEIKAELARLEGDAA